MDYYNLTFIEKKIFELSRDLFARKGIFPKHFLLSPMPYQHLLDISEEEKIFYKKEYLSKRKVHFWGEAILINNYSVYPKKREGNWIEIVI